jgi:hypothetical protein
VFYLLDFTSVDLQAQAKRLAPALLRIGGGMADALVFGEPGAVCVRQHELRTTLAHVQHRCWRWPGPTPNGTSYVIAWPYWDQIVAFGRATGLPIVFDLNCLHLRTPENTWNSSNAESLFRYLLANNQTDAIYAFELGNEVRRARVAGLHASLGCVADHGGPGPRCGR